MSDEGSNHDWKERFHRARSRLIFAMGSTISAPVEKSTFLVDAVNEVFRALDEMHLLQVQKLDSIHGELRKELLSCKSKQPGKEEGEEQHEGKRSGEEDDLRKEEQTGKETSNHEAEREVQGPFSRYKIRRKGEPGDGEKTLSVDITRRQDLNDDDDGMQAPLRSTYEPRAKIAPHNDAARENRNGSATKTGAGSTLGTGSGPVKKRDMELSSKERGRNEVPVSKKHKTAPCKKCKEKQKELLTDEHGFFDQREFGKWLKNGMCLEEVHFPRCTKLAPPRPKISTQEYYKDSFPETETQPPPGYGQ